jgi:hypothetical protein
VSPKDVDAYQQLMRELLVERFTHLPESTGPVDGPTADAMHAAEVVQLDHVRRAKLAHQRGARKRRARS